MKYDLETDGTGSNSLSQLSSRSCFSRIGGCGEAAVEVVSQTLSNQECHRKGRNHLADPLSAHQLRRVTREDSQTFLAAVISFWVRPVSKSKSVSLATDSDLFGSQT